MQNNSGDVTPEPQPSSTEQEYEVRVCVIANSAENATFKAYCLLADGGEPDKVVPLPDLNSCEDHWGCAHWTDDDLSSRLRERKIEPTPENIAKLHDEWGIRHIADGMVSLGWETIDSCISDVFPNAVEPEDVVEEGEEEEDAG